MFSVAEFLLVVYSCSVVNIRFLVRFDLLIIQNIVFCLVPFN